MAYYWQELPPFWPRTSEYVDAQQERTQQISIWSLTQYLLSSCSSLLLLVSQLFLEVSLWHISTICAGATSLSASTRWQKNWRKNLTGLTLPCPLMRTSSASRTLLALCNNSSQPILYRRKHPSPVLAKIHEHDVSSLLKFDLALQSTLWCLINIESM